MQNSTNKTSIILEKVASLTAIRDIEAFDFSFLKTLAELLKVQEICLFKINSFHEPCHSLRYSSDVTRTNNKETINELIEIQIEDIEIPEEIKRAQNWIHTTDKVYSIDRDGLFFMVYPVIGLKGIVGYLSLNLFKKLTDYETHVISCILSISHNFYSLLEENQKDKLTGLLNRKTLESNISKIQSILNSENQTCSYTGKDKRIDRQGDKFWLAILDIDHFKRVNDTFGHIYGDEVLLTLSQVMKQTFRTKDLLFRFGGEEFISIVQVTDKQLAEHILERFRLAIEAYDFPQVGRITISIGATQIVEQYSIASEIVGRADHALYQAKETGRNRLYFYEDLVNEGVLKDKVEEGSAEIF